MSPVAAPADRRFRRAHVKPSRRRRRWQTLVKPALTWIAAALIAAYGAYRLTDVVVHAHALQVRHISVRGNVRLSTGEVVGMLSGLQGESIVWADLPAWRRTLLASPWVRDAALRRSLPSTVEVVISERQPVGVARINGDMFLVDERGVVIDQYGPEQASLDLPIIDGLSVKSTDDGAMADEARGALAGRVIAALRARPAIAGRLSQIDVTDAHDAVVLLNDDRSELHLGDDQFLQRLESYLDLRPALAERVAEFDSVDLRFDNRVYVKPVAARHPNGRGAGSAAGRIDQGHGRTPELPRPGSAPATGRSKPKKR
jgi:cell division protein FtsQ